MGWSHGSVQTGNKGLGRAVNCWSVEDVPENTWASQQRVGDTVSGAED